MSIVCSWVFQHRSAGVLALLWLSVSGCSSDDATIVEAASMVEPTPGTEGGPGTEEGSNPATERLYAITTRVFPSTTYLAILPSLDAGTVMDTGSMIELPENGNVSGIPGQPYAWHSSFESPTIQRWDLQADGALVPGPVLSFANLGAVNVDPAYGGAYISAELAAVPSNATGDLIFWNPRDMTIVGTLNLGVESYESIPPLLRSVAARPDGTLVVSYYHYDGSSGTFGNVAGVVFVDVDEMRVIGRDEWEGCNHNYTRITDDGTVYLTLRTSWLQRSLIYSEGPRLAQNCLLRILPGALELDRGFDPRTLETVSGGRHISGSFEPAGDGSAYFLAWQEELASEQFTAENFDELSSLAAYKWYRWDMAASVAVALDAAPFSNSPEVVNVDGELYFANTQLASGEQLGIAPHYELTPGGTGEAFIAYGFPILFWRMR